jgi:outer membrane immunogenic protein
MEAVMRRLLAAFGLMVSISPALGADLPVLRGSDRYLPLPPTPVFLRWEGFYAGGQISFNGAHMDFNPSASLPGSLLVSGAGNTFTVPVGTGQRDPRGFGFGAFAGYNTQWDDVVVGGEINYNHVSLTATATQISQSSAVALVDGHAYDLSALGTNSLRITDYATFRARAGWVVDCILPYLMVGLAVGNAQITHLASVTATPTAGGPGTAFVATGGDQGSQVAWGYSAGVGIDVAVAPEVFLRAEYEFVQFAPISGMNASINTLRAGAGYKF